MENNDLKMKDFITFYFIESHLDEINNDIEVVVDSSYKCLKPLRKVNEKKSKDQKNQVYVISVYGIDIITSLITKKEIKNMNEVSCILIKLSLKVKKNKFESQHYVPINCDTFTPNIKFEIQKKLFGKDTHPPEQMQLSNLEIIQFFNDTLLIKERIKSNDITFITFLQFCVKQLKKIELIELELYYMIFINILNNSNIQLIKDILDLFNMNKLIKPLKSNVLAPYIEKIEILYNEQNNILDTIQKIPNINFKLYLYKYYTIHIYIYSIKENYETCEKIMLDLRDNNPYDNLILPKLFLSEYSNFYRNIPISIDLQRSLIEKYIYVSSNYNELVTSFFLLSDFYKKDFSTILLIITQNYAKIYEICRNKNCSLNIIDFINQSPTDDLLQIQNYLDFITKKKLENNFKSINFTLKIWDFYLLNGNNMHFLEYLKDNLIIGSISYDEIVQSLFYLTKYAHKNFIEILYLIVKNYDKFRSICINERKLIIINQFIEPSVNDNPDKIKEYLSYIVSEKLKDQYETISFDINIWIFYISNHYKSEFLTFIEMKLYESALNSKDIIDCLFFSSNFKKKSFICMLETVLYNFDKIQSIFIKENTSIDIQEFIYQQQNDDLDKIYELIKKIIEKELLKSYCSIKFDVNLWSLYCNSQSLDYLKSIRQIINECKRIQPNLDENKIQLAKKIHYAGFYEIQKGTLNGEKLLKFIGEEETFYINNQISKCIQVNDLMQNKVDDQKIEISKLKEQKSKLETEVSSLQSENKSLNSQINNLESTIRNLKHEISERRRQRSRDDD